MLSTYLALWFVGNEEVCHNIPAEEHQEDKECDIAPPHGLLLLLLLLLLLWPAPACCHNHTICNRPHKHSHSITLIYSIAEQEKVVIMV